MNQGGVGPAIGIIIIVALVAIGGAYFFLSQQNEPPIELPPIEEEAL